MKNGERRPRWILPEWQEKRSTDNLCGQIEKEKLFSEVYSPVSNLVKDTDISFNIQIGIVP